MFRLRIYSENAVNCAFVFKHVLWTCFHLCIFIEIGLVRAKWRALVYRRGLGLTFNLYLLFQLPFQLVLARLTWAVPFVSARRCLCQLFRCFFALLGEQLLVSAEFCFFRILRYALISFTFFLFTRSSRILARRWDAFLGSVKCRVILVMDIFFFLKVYYVLIYNDVGFEHVL